MRRLLRKPLTVLCATVLVAISPSPSTAAGPRAVSGDAPIPRQVGVDSPRDAALAGIVLDAASQEPVPGATITVGSAHVVAGANGRFTLTAVGGEVALTVAAPGYFTLNTTVAIVSAGGSTVELLMVRESSVVDDVLVQAPFVDGPPAARRVDPTEVLQTAGALDNIFRALQVLPGVAAAQEVLGFLTVRGGSPDQNLTLLDGVEVHDPYRLYGLASAFNPEAIQRFDLATGGFSARYGDRLSSLLSVESRDGVSTRRLRGSASMSVTDANVVLEGAVPGLENASWLLNTRRTYYDVIANLVSDQEFPGFEDVQAKGVWTPRPGRKLTLFGLGSRQGGDFRIDADDVDAQFVDDTKNTLGWARFESTVGSRGHTLTVAGVSDTRLTTGVDGLFADKGRRSNAPGPLPVRQANVGFGLDIAVRDVSMRQEVGWAVHGHTLNAGLEAHRLTTRLDWSLQGDRNPNVSGSSIQGGAGLPDALGSSIRATRGGPRRGVFGARRHAPRPRGGDRRVAPVAARLHLVAPG
jgi:TonB-dependent Receptor Plug Domain/CarboxypepD_reg-like domain